MVVWQRRSAKLALATLAVLITSGVCELAARVLLPAPPDDTRQPRIAYRYDSEIRYVLSPSQQGWIDDGWLTINSLGFRGRTVRALAAAVSRIRHLGLADSLGIDFHKTGFAPYISSLFLLRDRADFAAVVRQRETMPYLYHTGEYHPGMFTLETSRSATGVMAALANLLLLGKEGYRTLIGHSVEIDRKSVV